MSRSLSSLVIQNSRPAYGFGALLLGYYQEEELMYCGRVGTGFTETSLRELTRRLKQLETDECPYAVRPKGPQLRGVTWLEPRLVAEISYATRTSDGILRHSVFHGLREDKPAEQISWEQPCRLNAVAASVDQIKEIEQVGDKETCDRREKAKRGKVRDVGGVITHPDRVVYPEAEITKQELVNYFQELDNGCCWHRRSAVSFIALSARCRATLLLSKRVRRAIQCGHRSRDHTRERSRDYVCCSKEHRWSHRASAMNTIEFHPWPALAKSVEKPIGWYSILIQVKVQTWVAVIAAPS